LPSPLNQMQLALEFFNDHPDIVMSLPKDPDEDEFPLPVPPWTRLIWHVGSMHEFRNVEPVLADFAQDFQRRTLIDIIGGTERSQWDGILPLRELFDDEIAGPSAEMLDVLIDQRFVDYLHAQPIDMTQMNWRQFELLIGEFFRRSGYEVHVTPPSGDGGVDVRAHRAVGELGPELVLIQAKRYATDRSVGIEAVKALWSDVNEAGATRGVIATTSKLAPGARAYCEARRYRLTAAERPTVDQWLRGLATYPR
jgi:HJR/Mrr/RecB family endonuclease